jgi:hypothetical protein
MNISIRLRVSHYLALQASSLARMYRGIVGTRSRNWLTESHCVKPHHVHHGLRLIVIALVVTLISGLTLAKPSTSALPVAVKQFEIGAPCTTMTDIKEGTCNLKVDKIKRNAGQPKPFTSNWRN